MVWGMTGKGVRLRVATRHQAGLLTRMRLSQEANVTQWCFDWYGDYRGGEVSNPRGPDSGFSRVIRGGCWALPDELRAAYRRSTTPVERDNALGFRLALSPERVVSPPTATASQKN